MSPCHGEDHGFQPTADHPQGDKSKTMYYVYLIKSLNKNWVYIGSTDDLRKRFREHDLGLVKSTKAYRPFRLIYYEAYENKIDARKKEIELKKHGQKKEILFKQIENSLK